MSTIGLDIGGANLKASDTRRSRSIPFPLWRQPSQLADALSRLLADFSPITQLAVTMTGELADCYSSRDEGVQRILDAVATAAGRIPVRAWQTGGEFVSLDEARELAPLVAAANWHALATWAGRAVPRGAGLLLDMGSTTTDIIPLLDGLPDPRGWTDQERLASEELVYVGASRTPLCALVQHLELRGARVGIAREQFATMLDVQLLLGHVTEEPDNLDTADGRPATVVHSRQRLARMLCADAGDFADGELVELAGAFESSVLKLLRASLHQVIASSPQPICSIIFSGTGEPLLQRTVSAVAELASAEQLSLRSLLGEQHSQAACAYALSVLGSERG